MVTLNESTRIKSGHVDLEQVIKEVKLNLNDKNNVKISIIKLYPLYYCFNAEHYIFLIKIGLLIGGLVGQTYNL